MDNKSTLREVYVSLITNKKPGYFEINFCQDRLATRPNVGHGGLKSLRHGHKPSNKIIKTIN